MISTLTFIIINTLQQTMNLILNDGFDSTRSKLNNISGTVSGLFYFILVCTISFSLIQNSYAESNSGEQITFSDGLLNDPIAQDILKKIDQTNKMIEDLKQKEYEENQARENLERVRDLSVQRLNQKLSEWERLWEKHSSRNSFEQFVNKKPSFVQDVFWDQFEFKEQKVNAGRTAMNQVLANGGTMASAMNAYNQAASTKKIELIEMNAQFNVKHNLAHHAEQEMFNSKGKIALSPTIEKQLANRYTDYKLQASYILANLDDAKSSEINSNTKCDDGQALVSRVTSGNYACVDESLAQKWANNGVKGITVVGYDIPISKVGANPGTRCDDGNQLVYAVLASEYQCVSESVAKDMINNNSAEIHTLTEYILNKDKRKISENSIFEINQNILRISEEYDIKENLVESEFAKNLKNKDILTKQKIQEIIGDYKTNEDISKEDVAKQILELRNANQDVQERMIQDKLNILKNLELELKQRMLQIVSGYENNSNINVDWGYLTDTSTDVSGAVEKHLVNLTPVSIIDKNTEKIHLDNVGVINSFGQDFDEIKTDQVLQIAADLTNPNDYKQDFAYVVEITDNNNVLTQPAKWATGTLDSSQTFNVGLSWIPKETGEYKAVISIGEDIASISPVAEIKIDVNPEGNLSDENYCKYGHELLFKYSDNSPICASPDTASKLINIGLAFA